MKVLARLELLFQVPLPGPEMVHPPLDGIYIGPHIRNRELGPPPVVHPRLHRDRSPGRISSAAVEQPCRKRVVSVGEDIRAHLDLLSNHTLCGKSAAVDFGLHILDHDPFSAIFCQYDILSKNSGFYHASQKLLILFYHIKCYPMPQPAILCEEEAYGLYER